MDVLASAPCSGGLRPQFVDVGHSGTDCCRKDGFECQFAKLPQFVLVEVFYAETTFAVVPKVNMRQEAPFPLPIQWTTFIRRQSRSQTLIAQGLARSNGARRVRKEF